MKAYEAMKRAGVFNQATFASTTSTITTTSSFPTFDVTSSGGSTLIVDWDDGSGVENFAMTGLKVDVDRNYGSSSSRTVSFGGVGNTLITDLGCESLNVTSLDISENINLCNLDCSGNDLTSLDISSNILLELLGCNGNNLTSLDISSNVNLIQLAVNANGLSTLNITSNIAINELQVGNNNFPSSEINIHLSKLVENGLSNGVYNSSGQTPSAPPTGQGITDAATLVTRGWTLSTD